MGYHYLSKCEDYGLLRSRLDDSALRYIEECLTEYEEMSPEEYSELYEDYPTAVQWYEGCIDAFDLIDVLQ